MPSVASKTARQPLQVQQIHAQRLLQDSSLMFLVQWRNKPQKNDWQWKKDSELQSLAHFREKLDIFLRQKEEEGNASIIHSRKIIVKNRNQSILNTSQETKSKVVAKNDLSKKLKNQRNLEYYMGKSSHQDQKAECLQWNSDKLIQEEKRSLDQFRGFQTEKKTIKQKGRTDSQEKDCVGRIHSIKGVRLKGNSLYYIVETSNQKGQKLLDHPIPSETVKRTDREKVLQFLERLTGKGQPEPVGTRAS